MTPVAFLDASVLDPSTIRSVLMFLAAFDAFRAQWSEDIHREWTAALARDRPDLDAKRIARTRALMEAHLPNAMVTGYQRRIASLVLPDPNDRHVLAAALHCKPHLIVTTNLKDFPASALEVYGLIALHPDDFIVAQLDLDLYPALGAFKAMRARKRNPAYTAAEFAAAMERNGLVATAERLRRAVDLI